MQHIEEQLQHFISKTINQSRHSFDENWPSNLTSINSFDCKKCRDEGLVIDVERNVAILCECVSRRKINRALMHSCIGDEFRNKTFENFRADSGDLRVVNALRLTLEYASRFAEIRQKPKNSLGIVGAVGCGKTHLLCAVANHLLDQGVGVRYFNCVTGFKEMFAKYDQGGQAVRDIRWELQTCDVLMLDDIAKGKINDRINQVEISKAVYDEFYTIIDYRYFRGLPIIWSSERHIELAADTVLGEATASRLFEKSYLVNITYTKNEQRGTLNYRLKEFNIATKIQF